MPILERDPWRLQFFETVVCPDDITIPTDDPDCWALFPAQRWIYDKLRVAETQGLDCGPHGAKPPFYPVFSKPIINLKGMGVGSVAVMDASQMEQLYQPGHMWMTMLEGEHVSTDCAVVDGQLAWLRHAQGLTGAGGTFHYWIIEASVRPGLSAYLTAWVAKHMQGYTGMMNFESIGGRIIEAHLRFADQWCDLYGKGWTQALVRLYAEKRWAHDEAARTEGYSIPLFVGHGRMFRHPPQALQAELRARPGISSLQITFHDSEAQARQAMPPGGFRLAVINATDLAAGLAAREDLAGAFAAQGPAAQG